MADAAGTPLPFEGHVESDHNGEVHGWVWFPEAPEQTAKVEIVIGGDVKARIEADSEREDLAAAGKRGGRCAFSWAPDSESGEVTVRLADGRVLPGSPLTAAPRRILAVDAAVEVVTLGRVAGWAWFPEAPDEAVSVHVDVNGNLPAGAALATIHRSDLLDRRGGACGFEVSWEPASDLEVKQLKVRLADGRVLESFVFKPDAPPPRPTALKLMGLEGYLERFDDHIRGWAAPIDRGPHHVFSVRDGPTEIFTIEAAQWRKDLEDDHQGDGRGGFELPFPARLRDGRARNINLFLDGRPLLAQHIRHWLPPLEPPAPQTPQAIDIQRLARKAWNELKPIQFSFVVVFYNMRREAERTLTSLTRAYQRDSENIKYEVICVDNGSNPPLDETWVQSFGPEFRLVRPSKILPSPCFAINEAAAQARGKHVVIMVDGAHVLSPGVFCEAEAAAREHPQAVVAVRHWFIGGDQRWLSAAGYTRELEDILFARARWPSDGYKLFEISATMHENPNHWFDPIAESNCLFVPKDLWRRLGGMDERFDTPGGGFCNLDLLRRAGAAAAEGVTALVGEATFHQFHEGTTTNVTDAEKDSRVRAYASAYRNMRGEDFANIDTKKLRLRGRMHTDRAYSSRQRPLFQAPLGVTTRVRPGSMDRWLDLGAIEYINSAYAESGLHEQTRWRGERVGLAPADLTNLQEIMHEVRPERIVVTGDEPGIIRFLTDIAALEGLDDLRLVCVVDATPAQPHERVDYIVGPPYAAETLSQVERAIGPAESCLVLFSPRPDDLMPVDALRAYGRFVSFRSYLVVLRTVLGQPWLGYSMIWLRRAIFLFSKNSDFVTDETRQQHLITMCSAGYLLRAQAPKPAPEDDALENLGL